MDTGNDYDRNTRRGQIVTESRNSFQAKTGGLA